MRPALILALAYLAASATAHAAQQDAHRLRLPQDEVIYFLLPDRFENGDVGNDTGGYDGDRSVHGFDPTHKGFYHGGDLKGLTQRLDYIEDLGATAIWLGPIYKNKPVQADGDKQSAGYHGYWITDFTSVDPHFGTKEELKTFIDAAHARGLKVYFDIITNHTADVIAYRECHDPNYDGPDKLDGECPYRTKAAYPYTTRGDAKGEKINPGFLGSSAEFQTKENFSRLTRPDFAYTPFVPDGEQNVKKPEWLNDIIYYNNRGETTFEGENSVYGDFFGLDDIMTEHPRVLEGFIEIYKEWISTYKMDGFRIDTARHVNPEFWRAFIPAIQQHAVESGVPNFYMFGEVYDPDPAALARFTRVDGFPTVLDFAFQDAVTGVIARGEPTARMEALFRADDLYANGAETALTLPTFLGNHDMGRFSTFVVEGSPDATDEDNMKRVILGHAVMFFARGAPVIYSGDEQGFVGDGKDQDARESLFPSKVDIYNDNNLLGTDATTAQSNFDKRHPIFRAIKRMAGHYKEHEALRRGAQILRKTELDGGLLALSRLEPDGGEYLAVFNTRNEPRTAFIEVDPRSENWINIEGQCPRNSAATGSIEISIAPLSYTICKSNRWKQ